MSNDNRTGLKEHRPFDTMRDEARQRDRYFGPTTRDGAPPRARDEEGQLEKWRKQELYDRARKEGIRGRSNMSKNELIRALRDR